MIYQIALQLQKVGVTNMKVQPQAKDVRKTALLIIPAHNSFHIRIEFQMDTMDWIPSMMRLLPDRCNLTNHDNRNANTNLPSNEVHPSYSVQYNYSLTEDAMCRPSDRVDVELYSNMQIRHGVALITLWCRQRGLYILNQGFDDDIISVLVHYLIFTKRIPNSRTIQPISVLTSFLTLLSETQWLLPTSPTNSKEDRTKQTQRRTVLILPESIGNSRALTISQSEMAQRFKDVVQEELAHRKKNSLHGSNDPVRSVPTTLLDFYETTNVVTTPVLLNSTLQHNYLFRMSPSMMQRAQQYSKRSLSCLHPTASSTLLFTISHTNPFVHLFDSNSNVSLMNTTTESSPTTNIHTEAKSSFFTQYDAYLHVPLSEIDQNTKLKSAIACPHSWMYHWSYDIADLGYKEALVRGLLRTLRRALQDRILDIHALPFVDTTCDVSIESLKRHRKPKHESHKYVTLGFVMNPDTCYRVVDRCHAAATDVDNTSSNQSGAVEEFVSLWGSKAELRRFKDGAIVHAVVWDESSTASNQDLGSMESSSLYMQYHNDDTWQGGIVERIVRHILKLHFLKNIATNVPQFSIRDIVSMVDGVANRKNVLDASIKELPLASPPIFTNSMLSHRSVMKSFESLSEWLRKNSTPTIPVPGSAKAMKSVLGIPLSIDRVEALSPALRYSSLYPPVPHPLLSGGSSSASTTSLLPGLKKCSGVIQSDPVDFQICFGPSSKWPNDLKAIGAAKTAMLIEIVNGIENLKKSGNADSICRHFDERFSMVTPSYAIICFMGYVFRMTIKADREIQILKNLLNPSIEASRLLKSFTKQSITAAKHHAMVHGVFTSHPSSSATVRLIKRWLSSHLLASDGDCCMPFEVIELTVAHVFSNQSRLLAAPATVSSGFMEWLRFIFTYNWVKRPLIVDPQGHLSDADHYSITEQFELERGVSFRNGPAWYIIASYDRCIEDMDIDSENDESGVASNAESKSTNRLWMPTFSGAGPERVLSVRIAALAERTYSYLRQAILTPNDSRNVAMWPGVFQESRDAFRSYSALLRIDPSFIVNIEASSNSSLRSFLVQQIPVENHEGLFLYESSFSRSMRSLANGPKELRKKLYRNLLVADADGHHESSRKLLTQWNPVRAMIQQLRSKLEHLALIFYNDLCPEVIGIVWRQPIFFQPRSFSAVTSEFVRPVSNDHWQADTMISYNVHDVLRIISLYSRFLVSDIKVFDYGSRVSTSPMSSPKVDGVGQTQTKRSRKRKALVSVEDADDSNDDNSSTCS